MAGTHYVDNLGSQVTLEELWVADAVSSVHRLPVHAPARSRPDLRSPAAAACSSNPLIFPAAGTLISG